jgi:hypothetical protein
MAALATVATAGPASAASFEKRVYQGKVWYNDGDDRFCARADEVNIRDRAIIEVKLIPYNTSRGPTISFADIDYPGAECRSLATAYEDTHYKAVIKSLTNFDRVNGSTYQRTVVDFYS